MDQPKKSQAVAYMMRLIKKLYSVRLLRPRGIWALLRAWLREGINLMTILHYAARQFPERQAVCDGDRRVTYRELFESSHRLALQLRKQYRLEPGQSVALLCRNHIESAAALCAFSRLGVHVYLLNIEMAAPQLQSMLISRPFALVIYDEERAADIAILASDKCLLANHPNDRSVWSLMQDREPILAKLPRYEPGKIVLLTGGTSGNFKSASRKPSLAQFLYPAQAMLLDVEVDRYRSVYIATPIYHGYGLSAFMIAMFIGLEMYFLPRFKADAACKMISENGIEGATLVPLMLQRMLMHDKAALTSLRCILSGGAALSPGLAATVANDLGNVLFNLYGTSEAGFSVLARPEDLRAYPGTIGKPIRGVEIKFKDNDDRPEHSPNSGMLCLRTHIVMDDMRDAWVPTGDICYRNDQGFLFLKGRGDSMIVSGGENVFPEDLESVLLAHFAILNAAVIGIEDAEFGQRLRAFVVLKEGESLSNLELFTWLSGHVARYQMPAQITFLEALPMTATGKTDRVALSTIGA